MKKLIILALLVVAGVCKVSAQTQSEDPKLMKLFDKSMTLAKFSALPDDEFWKPSKALMYQNQGFDDGHGMYAWPPALKHFPKRVGILTYMVFDPGFFESSSKRYGYVTLVKSSSGFISAATTQELAQGFYDLSIGALKAEFEKYGSTLLTPQEFLTTDSLKEAYKNFKFEEKGLAKMMSKEGAALTLAVPEGYQKYYVENFTMPAFVDAITAKIKELGLDAAILVKIQMGAVENDISLQSVTMAMYGANPVPKDPKKKYIAINPATGYHEGVVYTAIKLGAFDTQNMLETKEGLNILVFSQNKNGARSDFVDFDKVIGRIGGGMNYCLNQWITGGWKPFKYK